MGSVAIGISEPYAFFGKKRGAFEMVTVKVGTPYEGCTEISELPGDLASRALITQKA